MNEYHQNAIPIRPRVILQPRNQPQNFATLNDLIKNKMVKEVKFLVSPEGKYIASCVIPAEVNDMIIMGSGVSASEALSALQTEIYNKQFIF